ncbi:hypothetical protein [Natronolimnohabitans innermongolicus]|uniref:CARDB domain-containing protein n=1 Tax=Natronolimnohabitans innermongolicus JCM 12255 TaxID=1227499 RepID=L9X9X1_9EURY|nr:hypothetical protein [Natronolimnohabitans innermongolicus]ELY57428.1 hypothetical protein C493_08081 [Natronolimnohabitans innermongolicus JCM 12255]
MERRTFITTAGTGIGIGVGVAGCLDDGSGDGAGPGEGDDGETVDLEDGDEGDADASDTETETDADGDTDGNGEADSDGTDDADGDDGDDERDADDDSETTPATFEVASLSTTSPVDGGDTLEVSATIENVGDETGTTDVVLVVGHEPQTEDSQDLTLEAGESADITLEFRTGEPASGSESFPVTVETGADEASETVTVGADDNGDENGDTETGVSFDSCSRATVSGPFDDGDVAYASTGFYDSAGYGNTLIEDGVTIGEDVDAPLDGPIVFEIGDDGGVSESGDEVVVTIPDYGDYGTVITGLTTDEDDYVMAGVTHENPHADDCLAELEAEWEADEGNENGGEDEAGNDDGGSEPTPATFEVASLSTTSPVGGGDTLEVSATIENVGDETGTTDIELIIGHSPQTEDSQDLTLEAGETATITLEFRAGDPAGGRESFPARVDTGADSASETVTVE